MGLKKIPVGPQDYPLQLVWGVPPIALSRVLFGFIKVFIFITRILLDKKSHQIIAQSNGNLFLLTPPGLAAVTGGSSGAGWLRVAPRRGLGLSCGEWPRRCALTRCIATAAARHGGGVSAAEAVARHGG